VQPAIFLDRDETLTIDHGYTYKISDFEWKAGVLDALKRFCDAKLPLFIVTNQGGIALNYFSEADMHAFHAHLQAEAAKYGIYFTDIAFCPHHPKAPNIEMPDGCSCRKPEPGLIISLAKRWQIDLPSSVMIGDRQSDIEAGNRAGCTSYFDRDPGAGRHTLAAQADFILHTHFPDRIAT